MQQYDYYAVIYADEKENGKVETATLFTSKSLRHCRRFLHDLINLNDGAYSGEIIGQYFDKPFNTKYETPHHLSQLKKAHEERKRLAHTVYETLCNKINEGDTYEC